MTFAPSAHAKLARAKSHRDQLRDQVNAFRAKDAYSFYVTQRTDPFDSAMVVAEYRVRVSEEPPTMEWAVTLGDTLTNLRAVLDHAIYFHVTSRISLTTRQVAAIKFPLCDDQQQWNSWNGQPLSRQWISATFRDAIEAVQPVTSSLTDPRHATLYALNELVNIDKHRACHVVAYSGEATFDRNNDPLQSGFMRTSRGTRLTDGAVIATKKFLRPLPGSGTARIDFEGLAGYTEVVELPNVGPLPMLGLCDLMVERVAEVLAALEQAH